MKVTRVLLKVLLGSLVTVALSCEATAGLIPPFYFDCVVAIGRRPLAVNKTSDGTIQVRRGSFKPVASGFLYGDFVKKLDETQNEYHVYLVTNRHVVDGIERSERKQIEVLSKKLSIKNAPTISLRFNPKDNKPARDDFSIPLRKPNGTKTWFQHKEGDVAIIPINVRLLRQEGIQFSYFQSDNHVADTERAIELGIMEGDGVYTLGFPLGLVGGDRNFVIARQGSISRIRDFLAGASKEFLVDVFVFPGNSGGPVIIRPEFTKIKGTQRQSVGYLIGLVRGFIAYRDVAVSRRSGRERIVFEENLGLAAVIPIDFVKELVQLHRKTHPASSTSGN